MKPEFCAYCAGVRIGADEGNPLRTSVFDLPNHLKAKADPALIAGDERHFAAIAESLEHTIADLSERLEIERKAPGGTGQRALDRDQEIHRLTARLRALGRFGLDLCLGHIVRADDPEPVYIGRLGLTDSTGRRLLLDWRGPVAEPFFGATHANPMGLASRRRYRWTRGRISDYWDEVFTPDGFAGHSPALDDQSAFIASLSGNRTARMRDVLGTIQADQDAIIRAGSSGALVVDGGPGTGKTVVALHRAAYLLYSDPRLGHHSGDVLIVGPHEPYLAYVEDVLPSLGEEGVQTCTLRDLVPEGATAPEEADPRVAQLKSSVDLVQAIDAAVRFYEEPPTKALTVTTDWAEVRRDRWRLGRGVRRARPRYAAQRRSRGDLAGAGDDPDRQARRGRPGGPAAADRCSRTTNCSAVLNRAWPLLEATDLVADLWSVPAYLRTCAPWLEVDDVRALQRSDAQAWTVSDLPLLDAARQRLGDPEATRRQRRREAAVAAERERISAVVDDLIATDDSEMKVMSMLRGEDARTLWVDETTLPGADPDRLAGPFAHIVVDEAQELTDAEWQMLLVRCPVPQLHRRRGSGPGPTWVHRIVAAAARAGRLRPDHVGLVEHQLPDARGGHGRGRAGHPSRAAGRQRAHLDSHRRCPRRPCLSRGAGTDPGRLARHARRRSRLCHRRPGLPGPAAGPVADAAAGQGSRVRPRRPRRPRAVRPGHRGSR